MRTWLEPIVALRGTLARRFLRTREVSMTSPASTPTRHWGIPTLAAALLLATLVGAGPATAQAAGAATGQLHRGQSRGSARPWIPP